MELLIATVVGYSGILAPVLATWATANLYLQPQESDCGYCQTAYFGAMLFIGFLTVRTMLMHDECWLINAASLGVLIVGGALKRPVDDSASSVLTGG